MINQIITLTFLAATANAGLSFIGGGLGYDGGTGGHASAAPAIAKQTVIDYYTPAKYEFKYGVDDPKTGDRKQQSEIREGDTVKGEYSLAEPDGTIRIVKYTADKVNGFNAVVSRVGHAAHPQLTAQKAVPLAINVGYEGGLAGHGSEGGIGEHALGGGLEHGY